MKSKLTNKKLLKKSISILVLIALIFTLITVPSTKAFAANESVKLGDADNPPEVTVEYVGTNPKYPVVGEEIEVTYKITAEKFNYTIPDKEKEIVIVIDASESMKWCSDSSTNLDKEGTHTHLGGTCNVVSMDLTTGKCSVHPNEELPHKNIGTEVCNGERVDNYCLVHGVVEESDNTCTGEKKNDYCEVHEVSGSHNKVDSVCNASRLEMTKYAAINFVEKLSDIDNLKIGLVTYKKYAEIYEPIEISKKIVDNNDVNLNNRNDLINKIKDINVDKEPTYSNGKEDTNGDGTIKLSSGTNIGEALRKAAAVLGENDREDINRSLILMTDGAPTKFSSTNKSDYYEEINFDRPNYVSGNEEAAQPLEYAKVMGKKIADKGYNNIYSIGYALEDKKEDTNNSSKGTAEKLQEIHSSMGASNNTLYTTQGHAIDDLFNKIADDLKLDYKFDAQMEISLNNKFEAVENIVDKDGKKIITIPQIDYELKEGTTNEYLPNGKEKEEIELKFKVKPLNAGELDLFNEAKIKYTDLKGIVHEVELGGPTINVSNTPPIPVIEAVLTSDEVVNVLPEDEVEVKYMVTPEPFEHIANSNAEDKEVAFVIDTSSDMLALEKVKTSLINRMINHFLNNNTNQSNMRFNIITYNSEVNNMLVDENVNDYRHELQLKINSVVNSNSSDKKLGEAIEEADKFFKKKENPDSIKNIVIIAAGDPTDDFPDIDIDDYNVMTLAVSKQENYNNPYEKLKEWHDNLGGIDDNYFVSMGKENNNDIDSTPTGANNNPLAPNGDIMAVMADKLVGMNFRAYSIKDVKLNFDLSLNFDVVSGLKENGANYYIDVPKIRYVATEKVGDSNTRYKYESKPVEVSFIIKPKANKYGVLEFAKNTSDNIRNFVSYTRIDKSNAVNPIDKTPKVIVKDKRVTIQVRDSYGDIDDKYDTSNDETESLVYLRNEIKNQFGKDYRLYGDSYANITFEGSDMNYVKYKISTNNEIPTDNSWDNEIVQKGGNPEGVISDDVGEQGFLTHQSYDVSHLGLIGSDTDENLNNQWSNRELLYKYPYYDGIEDKPAGTSAANDVNGYVKKVNYYNPITGKTEERWVPQTVFTEYAKVGRTYKEASKTWGYIKVDKSGTYNFKTLSDDGMRATLTVKGKEVELVDLFYLHSPLWSDTLTDKESNSLEGTVSVELEAGVYYPIFIEYFNYGLEAAYRVMYSGPDSNNKWTNIPSSAFYSSKSKKPGEGANNGFSGEAGIKLPEDVGLYYIAYESGKKTDGNYEVKSTGVYGPFEITNRFELTRTIEYVNDDYYELSYNIKPNDIELTDIYRTQQEIDKFINSSELITKLDVTNINLSDKIPDELKLISTINVDGSPTLNIPSQIIDGQLAGSLSENVNYTLDKSGDAEDWKYTSPEFTLKLKLQPKSTIEDDIEMADRIAKLTYNDIIIKNGARHNKEQYFNGIKVEAPQNSLITEQGLFNGNKIDKNVDSIDVVDDNDSKPIYTMGTKLQINSKQSVFRIALPIGAELVDNKAYTYEVSTNGNIDKNTKKEMYVSNDDNRTVISNKNSQNKIGLEKDKEYIVVYKIKLSNVKTDVNQTIDEENDSNSTFINSQIDKDVNHRVYFRRAELPDLF